MSILSVGFAPFGAGYAKIQDKWREYGMTDQNSYEAQAEANRLTLGMVPHPATKILKGGPFSSVTDVIIHGQHQETPPGAAPAVSSGEGGSGTGVVGPVLLAVLFLCIFMGGIFYVGKLLEPATIAPPAIVSEEYHYVANVNTNLSSCMRPGCKSNISIHKGDLVKLVHPVANEPGWGRFEANDHGYPVQGFALLSQFHMQSGK